MFNKTTIAMALLGSISLARRSDQNGNGQIDKLFAACHIDVLDDKEANFFIGLINVEGRGARLVGSAITELQDGQQAADFCGDWAITINDVEQTNVSFEKKCSRDQDDEGLDLGRCKLR